jgi:hypothetical protein
MSGFYLKRRLNNREAKNAGNKLKDCKFTNGGFLR